MMLKLKYLKKTDSLLTKGWFWMIKDLIDRVLASFKEDCDNITNLYGEEYSCGYCKHRKICEAIYKLKIKR